MAGILSRYLLRQTARGVVVALCVVLVLIVLVDFVEQTRTVDVAIEGTNLLDFVGLTLLKTPMMLETTLPFILLFGVMLTMFQMNRRSELVVMRAAGVSAWRFVAAPVVVAVVIGVASPLLLNPVAASYVQRFEAARAMLTGGVDTNARAGDRWFMEFDGDQRRLIRAADIDPQSLTLRDVTFIFFGANGVGPDFDHRLDAASARYQDGQWLLQDAVQTVPGARETLGTVSIPAYLDVAALGRDADVDAISFWSLPKAMAAAREVGVSPEPYRLRWLRLLMTPLLFVGMALIACAASLRLRRLGGALQLVILGGVAGFGLYFLGGMLDALAVGGRMPLLLAAGAAPVGATLAALAAIAYFENS